MQPEQMDPLTEGTVEAGDVVVDESIALNVHGPRTARKLVADTLRDRVSPAVAERAQVVVSELMTNSLVHSGVAGLEPARLRIRVADGSCRIEVQDEGRGAAFTPRPADLLHGGGMGLRLVDTFSECWGMVRSEVAPTRVWAQLACAG
jgi:serine/threonine-protein kinase RsbW